MRWFNKIAAVLQLVRWPNLFFIFLTQVLFYYSVYYSLVSGNQKYLVFEKSSLFFLLVFSSVLIAAAGYIINDYFDVQIDAINKPDRIIVDHKLNRRWAILFHMLFSVAGVICSFYVSYKAGNPLIAIINLGCVLLLWFYSTYFKKSLLLGNLVISLLTAWVTMVVYLFVGGRIVYYHGWHNAIQPFDIRKLFLLTLSYSGFAFILSLIREAVKDIEDMPGDAKHGCRTMPIIWGIPAAKIYTGVWLSVIIAALGIVLFYMLQSGWKAGSVYMLVFIIVPLIIVLKNLKNAKSTSDYHRISNTIKYIMLAGILSMLFFISPIR